MSNHHPKQDIEHFHHLQELPSSHQLEHTKLVYGNRNQISGALRWRMGAADCKEAQANFRVVVTGGCMCLPKLISEHKMGAFYGISIICQQS